MTVFKKILLCTISISLLAYLMLYNLILVCKGLDYRPFRSFSKLLLLYLFLCPKTGIKTSYILLSLACKASLRKFLLLPEKMYERHFLLQLLVLAYILLFSCTQKAS